MGFRTESQERPSSGQDRTGRSRRRAKAVGRLSVVGGRRKQLRLGHLSVLRKGNRIAPSYRNINGAWPVESRRVEGFWKSRSRSRSKEGCSLRSPRWDGDLDVGRVLAGSRSTSVVWPDAAGCGMGGVEGEVWFGRLQLSDAVNTISLQGWWPLKQSSWSGKKAGPQFFGGDANLARWAAELGCFGHNSFKYFGPSTRCHKDVANGMFHERRRIESIAVYKSTRPGGHVSAEGVADKMALGHSRRGVPAELPRHSLTRSALQVPTDHHSI